MEKFPINNHETDESEAVRLQQELDAKELPEEYKKLIEEVRLIKLQEPYADNLYERLKNDELKDLLEKKFTDETVVDLGCGDASRIAAISDRLGSKKYIGVDLDPFLMPPPVVGPINIDESVDPETLRGSILKKSNSQFSKDVIIEDIKPIEPGPRVDTPEVISTYENNVLLIKGDMLNAISRLKTNSIGVVIVSGIEVFDNFEASADYLKALAQEIKRILHDGGILINNFSDLSSTYLDEESGGSRKIRDLVEKESAVYEITK